MRKTISAILIGLMIIMSFPISFAADNNKVSDEIRKMTEMLNALEISDIDVDKTVMNEGVAQKLFVNMIMNSLFDSFDTENDTLVAEAAAGLKIIKENEYKPNKLLEKDAAAEMALAALGYDIFDGYNAPAERRARQAVLNGVEYKGKYITASEAVIMICNMLEEKVLYVYAISDGYVKTQTSENETILSYYRNISKLEGIVTDSGISNLYGESTIGIDKAYVGDYPIDCQPGQMRDYLGMNVEAYTRPDSGADARLLYVCEKDNEIIKIDDEDIISADLSEIRYEDEKSNERKVSISSLAKLIYNGEAYTDYTKANIDVKNGFIELIDNDGEGGIDVIKVTEYRTIIVKYISPSEGIIISEFENEKVMTGIKLDLINNKKQRIIKNNAEIEMSEINVGDILSVAQSKSGRVADVYVSDKKLTGYIEKINTGRYELMIDGNIYKYSKELEQSFEYDEIYARNPKLGTEYEFYIDIQGRISGIKLSGSMEILYGYLVDMAVYGVFEKKVELKLYDKDGEWVEYELKDKLRFNGESGKKPEDVSNTLGENFETQLIEYKLSSDNKITELNIAVSTQELGFDGFSKRGEEELAYISQSTSFANTIFIDGDALMWFIPEDKTREDLYFIGGTGDLIADRKYTVTAYNTDNSSSAKYFTVKLTEDDVSNQAMMFALVTGVGQKIGADGDVVNSVTCHIDKYSDETLTLDDSIDISEIKQGDIMRMYLNPAGKVEKCVNLWSVADGEKISIPDVSSLRNNRALGVMGKIKAAYPDKSLITLVNGGGVQSLRLRTGGRILIYYKDRNIVKDASLDELMPNDYAVLFSRGSSIYNAVIIR